MNRPSKAQRRLNGIFGQQLKGFDLFSEALPNFNIAGRNSVQTNAGGCASLFIVVVTILFVAQKLQIMLLRKDKIVSTYHDSEIDEKFSEKFDTRENNFMMAFALSDSVTGEIKSDSRYLKWYAIAHSKVEGKDLQ